MCMVKKSRLIVSLKNQKNILNFNKTVHQINRPKMHIKKERKLTRRLRGLLSKIIDLG